MATSAEVDLNSIIQDLKLLRAGGFRSLVTYGSASILAAIPELARSQGFDGTVIMGVWDPLSDAEIRQAISKSPFVDGYCAGNEGLGVRYLPAELAASMAVLRRSTGKPVTTSERIDAYLHEPYRDWLVGHSDWLFPIAHPFWALKPDSSDALRWILARHDWLTAQTGRQVVFKEAGIPTSGFSGFSEDAQVEFFETLESGDIEFFYFEAFDQPWKALFGRPYEVEAHWGLYDSKGFPKKIVSWLRTRKPRSP